MALDFRVWKEKKKMSNVPNTKVERTRNDWRLTKSCPDKFEDLGGKCNNLGRRDKYSH